MSSRRLRFGLLEDVLTCKLEGTSNDRLISGRKAYHRRSLSAPGTACGKERVRILIKVSLLLVWLQFDHSQISVSGYRREDLAVNPEIRMAHVRALLGIWHGQSNLAKVFSLHKL